VQGGDQEDPPPWGQRRTPRGGHIEAKVGELRGGSFTITERLAWGPRHSASCITSPFISTLHLLETKSVVIHFQGKAFNSGHLFAYQLAYQLGQLIRELKLGGANHDRMRKWVKTVHVSESTNHRETFPPQKEVDTTSSLLLKFDQSQERPTFK
jgi:hypothetical protein